MAVLFDLDDDDGASHRRSRENIPWGGLPLRGVVQSTSLKDRGGVGAPRLDETCDEPGPGTHSERDNQLAAALTCYPVALSVSSQLDLNDLHALAATCRSVHVSLTQYAGQLKAHSLRCVHEELPDLADGHASPVGREIDVQEPLEFASPVGAEGAVQRLIQGPEAEGRWPRGPYVSLSSPLGASGKIGACARDLVAPCRRCGTTVCRNCSAKPPSNARLKERHRRLCKTCLDAPMPAHLHPPAALPEPVDHSAGSSASSIRSVRSFSASSTSSGTSVVAEEAGGDPRPLHAFTSAAFLRGPCTCETRGVYLCLPCGQNLCAADTTYKRVWTWRSRYSTHIGGGLGTGLGEGNQGQKCGRGERCLEGGAKAVCWVEIDCSDGPSADAARELEGSSLSRTGTPDHTTNKPGYLQQEIEGIGGVVKKKVKKRVKVGATVTEYEDERESGKYLDRESKGLSRSWCGWCGRVCPNERDRSAWGSMLSDMTP